MADERQTPSGQSPANVLLTAVIAVAGIVGALFIAQRIWPPWHGRWFSNPLVLYGAVFLSMASMFARSYLLPYRERSAYKVSRRLSAVAMVITGAAFLVALVRP